MSTGLIKLLILVLLQNRLPTQLTERLTEIIEDYNSDLLLGRAAGHPNAMLPGLAAFPATDILEAMEAAIKVKLISGEQEHSDCEMLCWRHRRSCCSSSSCH